MKPLGLELVELRVAILHSAFILLPSLYGGFGVAIPWLSTGFEVALGGSGGE
jgi:hypothetical protein